MARKSAKNGGGPKANGGKVFELANVQIEAETTQLVTRIEGQTPQLVWNAWTEKPDTLKFRPLVNLNLETRYLLAVDLSAFEYRKPGVLSRGAGATFTNELEDWLKSDDTSAVLTALILPDRAYFEPTRNQAKDLTVNLEKIKKVQQGRGVFPTGDVFTVLRARGDPDFVFGRVVFEIRTGTREGPASIGVSLWVKDGRPVDEIVLRLCIARDATAATTCQGVQQVVGGFTGVDSVRTAREQFLPPDAALHFVELDPNGSAMGVFRRKEWPDGHFVAWQLGRSLTGLYSYLKNTMVRALSEAQFEEGKLLTQGSDLYELFFPTDTERGRGARAAFEDFVRPVMIDNAPVKADPLSVFVRMVPPGPDSVPVVPVGLMAVDVGQGPTFLGLKFRIETPLPAQTYQIAQGCLSRWLVVVPPEGGGGDRALKDALRPLSERMDAWDKSLIRNRMNAFDDWMRDPQIEPRTHDSGIAIVVVSHHDNDKLSFAPNDFTTSLAVRRTFGKPSLVILSGCGTGGPTALDFIRRFSEHGVSAMIATNTEVEGEMAGHFVDCLAEVTEQNALATDFNISRAYFRAITCLKERPKAPDAKKYGVRVLQYSLLGNGSLRLCPPTKAAP